MRPELACRGLLFVALACAPSTSLAQNFSRAEIRAATVRDTVKKIRFELADAEFNKRLASQTQAAFRMSPDEVLAADSYTRRKSDLLARADALDFELDRALSDNNFGGEEKALRATEEARKKGEVLRADFEFYVRLPSLATKRAGQPARAAMRLLAQTGEFTVARTYLLDQTLAPHQRPVVVPFVREP